MRDEGEKLAALFKDGAKIFVCGSASKLAKSTAEISKKIWLDKHPGCSNGDAINWLQVHKEDRYVRDVLMALCDFDSTPLLVLLNSRFMSSLR